MEKLRNVIIDLGVKEGSLPTKTSKQQTSTDGRFQSPDQDRTSILNLTQIPQHSLCSLFRRKTGYDITELVPRWCSVTGETEDFVCATFESLIPLGFVNFRRLRGEKFSVDFLKPLQPRVFVCFLRELIRVRQNSTLFFSGRGGRKVFVEARWGYSKVIRLCLLQLTFYNGLIALAHQICLTSLGIARTFLLENDQHKNLIDRCSVYSYCRKKLHGQPTAYKISPQ